MWYTDEWMLGKKTSDKAINTYRCLPGCKACPHPAQTATNPPQVGNRYWRRHGTRSLHHISS